MGDLKEGCLEGQGGCGLWTAILKRDRGGLHETVIVDQRLRGGEGKTHVSF